MAAGHGANHDRFVARRDDASRPAFLILRDSSTGCSGTRMGRCGNPREYGVFSTIRGISKGPDLPAPGALDGSLARAAEGPSTCGFWRAGMGVKWACVTGESVGRQRGSEGLGKHAALNAGGAAPELHDRSGAAPPWVEAEVRRLFLLLLPFTLGGLLLGLSLCCCHLAFLLATGCALANPMHHPTIQINIISISGVAGMSDSYTLGVDKSSRNKFLLAHRPRGSIQEMIEWRYARMMGTRFGAGVTCRYRNAGLVFLRPRLPVFLVAAAVNQHRRAPFSLAAVPAGGE